MKKGNEVVKEEAEPKKTKSKSLAERLKLKSSENARYVIDKQSLELHVQLTSNPTQFGQFHLGNMTRFKIFRNELWEIIGRFFKLQRVYEYSTHERTFLETIYRENWQVADMYIVLMHFLVNIVVICPVVISIIFHQFAYAPYSLNHPSN